MNNKQFISVLKEAMPEYIAEYEDSGMPFMCHAIEDCRIRGKISTWAEKRARERIKNMLETRSTLRFYLVAKFNANLVDRYKAAKEFWEELICYYDTFGDLLPTHLVVQQIKIRHPEWFDIESGTYI